MFSQKQAEVQAKIRQYRKNLDGKKKSLTK